MTADKGVYMTLAAQLLHWYRTNARDLPWRKDKDAYKIWVSEIMLQQTRVEAVKEYYKRWMERFPTPKALAQSSEQEVLACWQGLGYYSRARNLLLGVRKVCTEYGGIVPNDAARIQKLPGVGEYTAGAIASIAFDQRTPAIDGNVLRIFSRLFCLNEDIAKQSAKRKIKDLLHQYMPVRECGDFNQALMDLGAMICIPRKPRCPLCPLTNLCEAYEKEVQDVLPVKEPKKPPQKIMLVAGIIKRERTFLVQQRPAAGLLAGMWEFPTVEITAEETAMQALEDAVWNQLNQKIHVENKNSHYLHTFSHRQWDISFYHCEWLTGHDLPPNACWSDLKSINNIPWAGPHHKVAIKLSKLNQ
jgi:A/G-specific adenine glycosylase